ncbi:hypothetical protein PTKIN_Ptkin12aG0021200 [Pterospermum kingtungense]
MGGIGKTTLASVVYTQISSYFEGKCFLADVREISEKHGLVSLQKQLLSQILLEGGFHFSMVDEGKAIIRRRLLDKKVLVVIDNVDNLQHLKCLVGRCDWFGPGSRIIITTRDEQLLKSHRVHDIYRPTTLNENEALHLFNMKAFDGYIAREPDFIELSKRVVEYAGGLPLALEVLGSFLCGRGVALWKSTIERLKRDSNKEILDRLQIGFDELEESEKNIFLDIACFFDNQEEKDLVINILDGCYFSPLIGIDVLLKKSLIKDCGHYFWMHGLLREMGRKIVQNSLELGKLCRLWREKDVYDVLTNNTGLEAIEGMVIRRINGEQNMTFTLRSDAFLKMKKLRLLKVLYLPNCDDLKYLPNELRLLEWHGYPFKSLPSSFQMDNLVALHLPYSRIEQLLKGNRPLYKLKWVNLEGSQSLITTPDFTMSPNLESLTLEGSTRIRDVHPSIGFLRRLKLLNLRGCKSITSLPTKIEMESLETLILSGCSSLETFPEIDGGMKCLLELCLDGTRIKELPYSIGHLSNLVLLSLKGCCNLVTLPSSIGGCKSLKTLNLSSCSKVETLPENLQQVEFLEKLDLSETAMRKPPFFIFQFKNLKFLSFRGCKGPPSRLRTSFPSLFKMLQRGNTDSMALMLHPLSGLSSLTTLILRDCNLGEGAIPDDIFFLSSLEGLDLSGNNFFSLPATLTRVSRLVYLFLQDCKRLQSLPALLSSTESVHVDGCHSLEAYEKPSEIQSPFHSFSWIIATNCYRLMENNNALIMLKEHLKAFANSKLTFEMIVPGSEIPQWFSHQRDEASIKIPLPPNVRNDKQWMGIAFCCVFVSDFSNDDDNACEGYEIECIASIHGVNTRRICRFFNNFDKNRRRSRVTRDHLWLLYWSRDMLYPLSLEEKRSETTSVVDKECGGVEIFETCTGCHRLQGSERCNGGHKVNKCGVRIVYEEDLEDMEEIKEQCSSSTSAKFDDDGDITRNSTALTKRKRNVYEEDEEAGQSENDSAEETPQPKRLQKIINFIVGKEH